MRGKPDLSTSVNITDKDHPRGCGENQLKQAFAFRLDGSPPRMRGKPDLSTSVNITDKDHPRGCGENQLKQAFAFRLDGSPPRMRGKPTGTSCRFRLMRITPADAGKTH